MGIVTIALGGLLLVVWGLRVMIRLDKVNRERAQRRRESWEAGGHNGPPPGDYMGSGFNGI